MYYSKIMHLYLMCLRLFALFFDLLLKYTWNPVYYATGGDEYWDFLAVERKYGKGPR